MISLPTGAWRPAPPPAAGAGDLGLLVLSGVLARRLTAAGRPACELIGEGDLIRPGRNGSTGESGEAITWSVLADAELAVIDARLADRLRRWPETVEALLDRCLARADSLARHLTILSAHPVERRLLLALWHLAQRWGRVSPAGVRIPLPLTHGLLAEMIGVRRPSLSTAVGHLVEEGLLARLQGRSGWLLLGSPPGEEGELAELRSLRVGASEPAGAANGGPAPAPAQRRFSALVRSPD